MIIAITGPLGAGKDTAAEYLAEKMNGVHVSGGDVLREMIVSLGLEPKKAALGDFGTFLRTHYGQDAVTKQIQRKGASSEHLVASGFRSPVEAESWKERGAIILYISAPDTLRHTRVGTRGRDHDTFTQDDLKKLDQQEFASRAAMAENLTVVKDMADATVENDGSIEELYAKLDEFLVQYA